MNYQEIINLITDEANGARTDYERTEGMVSSAWTEKENAAYIKGLKKAIELVVDACSEDKA